MKAHIPSFNHCRILIVGDLMLDRYWFGDTSRISPEAPVPIVHLGKTDDRPGGAGNVALNLAALGCQVTLVGMVGQDHNGEVLTQQLENAGVRCLFHRCATFSTIVKARIFSKNQQLVRLDFEAPPPTSETAHLLELFQMALAEVDIVILSDYAKGTLQEMQKFIESAKNAGLPVLVDPKQKDFSLYHGATLATPNQKEFEAVVGMCTTQEELIGKGMRLMKECKFQALLITQGERGMTLLQHDTPPIQLPTRAREVYDVSGAGDTVIAVVAASLAAGESFEMAAMLANVAAGIVIRKLGTATLTLAELRRALQRHQDSEYGILTEEDLMVAVEDARAAGEKIIMTNGCFDLLHRGHVTYLEEAKALGHRLIIAVNDDASVKQLKGSSRPVNSLTERMALLAALRCVDWVVAFSEDTPERLIRKVMPDVLVKAGDYQVADIAGADFLLKNGKDVKIMSFLPGYSSTQLIQKMSQMV
ncbi:MAG: bifunctional D-glycero-beta-D-manno-heptose-7-phosphate kinase/D-glycero-beta-D-manno-heptose 1-phosphate adenylyltransferase HldE [Gammaproteobacteria bacterium]